MSDNPERSDDTTQPGETVTPTEPTLSAGSTEARATDGAVSVPPSVGAPDAELGAAAPAPASDAGTDVPPDDSAAPPLGSAGLSPAEDASPFQPPEFSEPESQSELASLQMLDDVELEVRIELGRAEMYIEDVLKLGVGSVVELDKLAGDPVDIFVNETLVARGEVLVLSDNFCVRINDIVSSIPELELST